MMIIACRYRTEEGECILENKPCDGCKDFPYFVDFEKMEREGEVVKGSQGKCCFFKNE